MDKRLLVIAGFVLSLGAYPANAQDLPDDELQINVSSYFDNFNVQVIYPSIALTKKIGETTSINGRYLVDMVSAASIRNANGSGGGEEEDEREGDFGRRGIDAVSAASSRGALIGGPDDTRHEFVGGVSQLIAGRVLSVNGIWSHENDYSSATIAGTLTQNFARKNTTLQLGYVRSWDRSFPVTETWTRTKDVTTYSVNLSQILGKRLIVQALFSYSDYTGYLADPYQKIQIGQTTYDSNSPDSRIRKALSGRFIYRLSPEASLQLGYRYYWDTWQLDSHTVSGLYQRHLSNAVDLGLGWRTYLQSKAYFFESNYLQPLEFMTVDNKLDVGFSNELQLNLTLKGGQGAGYLPMLMDDKLQLNFSLNIYQRHTATADWFSNRTDLVAAYFNAGLRYKL